MLRNPTPILLSSMIAALSGCTAPRMIAPENTDKYYPQASIRLGEAGSVVLHFSIGPDGRARDPITHDEPHVVDSGNALDGRTSSRLIEGAENYLRAATSMPNP